MISIPNNRSTLNGRVVKPLMALGFGIILITSAYAQAPQKSTGIDSNKVTRLFFAALSEKTIDEGAKAADLFSQVLQIDPSNDASLYELAGIRKKQNKYAEALPLLQKAVGLKPDNPWYWFALAEVYEKNNDFVKLEGVFAELIRLLPERVDVYFDQANAYFLQKKYDEALAVYDQVEKVAGPSDDLMLQRQKVYLQQGKIDKAADGMEQIIAANPSEIKYYLLLAEIYNGNKMPDKALKVLERAKKADPNNGMVHLALADIYRDKKNINSSYNELESAFGVADLSIEQKIRIILGYIPKFPDPAAKASALQLSKVLTTSHPTDARAFALYGDMLIQNDNLKEAKVNFQKAVSLNNQMYEAREQLVRIRLSENDLDGVIKDGEDALSFFPNQAWMNYFVGLAYQQKKDVNKAISYFKTATSLEAEDKGLLSQAYAALGDGYHQLKDDKSSDAAYDKSLTYDPDNSYALNNYAYYLSVRGEQLDKAAQMAKHANELKPDVPSFEDTYAWILFKQKKYSEAKAWIEKAMQHNNDKSAVQTEHYGDILFYVGEVDAAVTNWKKAKEYGAKSPALERKINEKKYIE